MLKKLRLSQTDTFENLVGTREITKMLVSFIEGEEHPISIGAEQGGIEKWDDFVIKGSNDHMRHIQIKRQTLRFGDELDECVRNKYVQGKNAANYRELSELDKTIKSLGEWIKSNKEDVEKRSFHLEVYEGGVEIKKGFKVRDLVNILEIHIRKDTSSASGLKNLYDEDNSMKNCKNWLTSWCEIETFEDVLSVLKVLSISYSNTETELVSNIKDILKRVFRIDKIDEVFSTISSYTSENSSYTGSIQPRALLDKLKQHLKPQVKSWTKFQNEGTNWEVSGIHDLENNSEIERPSVIVPIMWSSDNSYSHVLKLIGGCSEKCPISESIIRLSLHPFASIDILCTDGGSWKSLIKQKTGGTLGISENDIEYLRILPGEHSNSTSESLSLNCIDEIESYASDLNNEMYKCTFKIVNDKLIRKIREMNKGDLRTELEKRWINWKRVLDNSSDKQKHLFSEILHPKAEGDSVSGELRVGPKTTGLITESIFILLIVSVCLGDENNQLWESVTDQLKMKSFGLIYWSGPSQGNKNVIKIDADPYVGKIFEQELEDIIILTQSELCEIEMFKDDIAGDIDKIKLLTHPKYPKLLITQDKRFKRLLGESSISNFKAFFAKTIEEYSNVVEKAIDDIVDEVTI